MRHVRLLLMATALVFAAGVFAQDKAPPSRSLFSLLPSLGDKVLVEELKLKPEQVEKLQKHQADVMAKVRDLGPGGVPERDLGPVYAQNEKGLKEILTPEQFARLQGIALDQTVRRFGTVRLADEGAVLGELKVTDEQKRKLAANEPLEKVLDEGQMKTWRRLTGEPLKDVLRPDFGTGVGGGFGSTLPWQFTYATAADVVKELKITPEQQKQLAGLEKARADALKDSRSWSAGEHAKKIADADQAMVRGMDIVLDVNQVNRLHQIHRQQVQKGREPLAIFRDEALLPGLTLTEEQSKRLAAVESAHRKALHTTLLADESADAIAKRVTELRQATYDKFVATLEAPQQAKLKELLGAPFEGEVFPRRPGGRTFPTRFARESNLLFLRDKALGDELKLSADQARKIEAGVRALADEAAKHADARPAERSAALEKANARLVADILTPEQARRFRGILVQDLQKNATPGAVTRFPGVAEELKLTEEQTNRLAQGRSLASVLTPEQQKRLQDLAGAPYDKPLVLGGIPGELIAPGFGAPRLSPPELHCAAQKSVQEELTLTDTQRKQVADAEAAYRKAAEEAEVAPPSERAKKFQEATSAAGKAVADALKPEQSRRLDQIVLQFQAQPEGARDLAQVLTSPRVANELKLTDEQKERLRQKSLEVNRVEVLISQEARSGRNAPPELVTTLAEFRKQRLDRLLSVLTPEQRAGWKKIVGEPFTGNIPPQRDFGRPGGLFPPPGP